QSLRGAWEAWWDGALWVRRLEPEAEARRYEVPGVLDGARVFAWGEEAVGALVDLADGRHLLRLDPDGPPQDMGWVASYADVVVTSWRVCLVLSPDGTATLIAEDGERLPATVPPGYQPGRMVGTRVTYVEFAGPGPTLWVDHATGVQRVLQGRRARYEGPSASPPRFGLTNSADGLFVFDMETGEERLVPNSAFIWPNGFIVSADGTRVFGRDIQATYGVLLDAETGVELARFEGLEAVSVADFVGADQVILRDGWSDPPTSIRLTLSTGAREVWPGSWLARWGDADLLTEEGGSELWVLGVGREPWRILQGDSWWTGPEPIGSTGLILADAGDEAAVVDLERGPIWRGAHRLRISGDQAWSCDPVGFLDVDVSVPVLRTAEVSGTCQLWPARSSVTIQDGDTLSEVYADGGRVVVRELGEYEAVAYSYPAGPDLWATRAGDLYRFGPDGQAVLRWHLPEYSFLQLWSVDGRALLQTSGPAGTELFSIAAEGPVEGFRIEARELAIPGTFPLPPMDDQGRILVPEDGR
ncbi:MAG: hypothetical protein KC656_28935, partial [Myxococcales bacterium]|nr:hypothetical protein [Myxococcales bacterium]